MLIREMSGQESRDLLARLWVGNAVRGVTPRCDRLFLLA
jgi:hypothetical protein